MYVNIKFLGMLPNEQKFSLDAACEHGCGEPHH